MATSSKPFTQHDFGRPTAILSVLVLMALGLPGALLTLVAAAPPVQADPIGTITSFSGTGINNPTDIVTGPDGNLWFTNRNGNSIGRLTPAGVVSTFTTPGVVQPRSIVVGPDGLLWFTNQGNDRLGRITTAGAISLISSPGGGISNPFDLAIGADGNVWTTNTGNLSIGRVTPEGAGKYMSFLNVVGAPAEIALGPDGAMWASTNSAEVLRVALDGTFTEFVIAPLDPLGVVAGSDGNLWITSPFDATISRLTPAGARTDFTDPSLATPYGITAAPDGNLWFVNRTGGSVGRITPSGVISSYPSATVSTPGAITVGPDAALWFTNTGTNTIGRIAIGLSDRPTNVTGSAGSGQASVSWTAPAANGGSPISGYTALASPGGATCTWVAGPLSCVIPGLSNGTAYTVTVRATNGVGPGPPSAPSSVFTPIGPPTSPGPPGDLSATRWATGQANVHWTTPGGTGGSPVTGFTITASPGGHTCSAAAAARSCVVGGLTNDVPHTFVARAINAIGTSAPSNTSNVVVPTAGGLFHALPAPTRILDSRPPPENVGPFSTPWTAGVTRDIAVAGISGVPANASAVVLNATVTGTTGSSFLTLWPTGTTQPTASNVNWSAGQTIPNAVTVKVGSGGMVSLFNNAGSANVIVDAVGWYDDSPGLDGAGYVPLPPARVLDSRPPPEKVGPFTTAWGPAAVRQVTVAGVGGVPLDADTVVLNATVTGTTASSFLTVWPTGTTRPTASNLNWAAATTIPNAVTVKVGTGGTVSVYNNAGSAHVIFDVVGYFSPTSGSPFHPRDPARIQDSRPPPERVGPWTSAWGPTVGRTVSAINTGAVPSGAVAMLGNVTVTGTTASSFLTLWPVDAPEPTASSLNWTVGTTIANAITAKLAIDGNTWVKNSDGQVHVIIDVSGWYH